MTSDFQQKLAEKKILKKPPNQMCSLKIPECRHILKYSSLSYSCWKIIHFINESLTIQKIAQVLGYLLHSDFFKWKKKWLYSGSFMQSNLQLVWISADIKSLNQLRMNKINYRQWVNMNKVSWIAITVLGT